ncbi:MAG TPA: NUDIX hydrolase [Chitinophagaceae bacterium]|nr:NUDIX hydrolase [Chitinophagaceae bacterium]
MHIKIYFHDKPLFLCDDIDEEIAPYVHHDDAVFVDEFSTPAINSMLHEMRQAKIHAGILYHTNIEDLRKAVWKKFSVILAAGGAVLNQQKDILFIHRRGKWDLPKGKLDKKESLETCAVREVKEETGLKDVKLVESLLTTYHTYDESGKHILKESHWYLMHADSRQSLHPQTEEQITEINWVNQNEVGTYLKNSYPLIKDILKELRLHV